jgi:hypothetical protein
MADGIFATIVSKDRDANAQTNPIWVNISDGTNGISVDGSGNLSVILAANSGVDIGDVDVTSVVPGTGATNLGKAEDAVHASGDVGVEVLAVRNDTLASLVDTDGDYAPLQVDANGALYVAGSFSSNSEYNEDAAHTTGDTGTFVLAVRNTAQAALTSTDGDYSPIAVEDTGAVQISDGGNSITVDQGTHDNLQANANIQVGDTDVSASNPVPVSKDSNANAETNPLYVYQVNTVTSGNEVHDYDTASAVAADATSNHDYTVAGTTFLLKSVIVSGSGNIKAEIQTGPLASLTTKAVVFLNGRQGDTRQVEFNPAIEVPATSTGTVRIIRTNRQGAATDLYSTIIGSDV